MGIADTLDGKSDHRAAFTKFHLREHGPTLKRRRKVQIGWKPKVDDAGKPSEYHAALDAALTTDGAGLAETIVEAATSSTAQGPRSQRKHNEEVRSLLEQRRSEHDADRRKDLSKQVWKALRKQRRQRMGEEMDALAQKRRGLSSLRQILQKQAGVQRAMGVRDNDGGLQKDPGKTTEMFAKFYEDLYTETHACSEYLLQGAPRANPVTVQEVIQALRQFKKREDRRG